MKPYYSLNDYLQQTFGHKLYKLALRGGMTCPNRDGTIGTRGCLFCSPAGAGEFAEAIHGTVHDQIERAKLRIRKKTDASRFIAYFQDFSNTYAPVSHLRELFEAAIQPQEIEVLSIATRPDCLGEEVLSLLKELNTQKPVWVELGLQTSNERTARVIRRGYPLEVFDQAVEHLHCIGCQVIAHMILGLPGETKEDMLATAAHIAACGCDGIKLHLLHVLQGTDLAALFAQGLCPILSKDTYIELLGDILEHLPASMVIHRLTGDGPKSLLLAPMWSANKKDVLNSIHRSFQQRQIQQGRLYSFPL